MDITTETFKKYIQSQVSDKYQISIQDENLIRLDTPYAYGQVVFHPMEIVELIITNKADEEAAFYLHFQLKEEERAKELFGEMVSTLLSLEKKQVFKVLLTCTSALTTSFFAMELNKAVQALKLNYEFHAVSISKIYETGFDYDAILVAPQASFEYEKIKGIFLKQIVLQIPASIFASYSTGKLIELVMNAKKEKESLKEPSFEAVIRSAFNNPYRILSIVLINHINEYRIAYRIYDHGKPTLDKEVIKPEVSLQDFEELLEYIFLRHQNIDAIGMAFPGICYHGQLYHPLLDIGDGRNIGIYFAEEYNLPVMLINDVNALALGYYATNEDSENMIFHFQPRGMAEAGAGIVINGRLHRGRMHAAGEIGNMIKAVVDDKDEKILTPEGATEIVSKALLSYSALMATDKVVMYSELTPDMNVFREYLRQYMQEEFIPELVHVVHLKDYMLSGAMIHALEILNKNPEIFKASNYDLKDGELFSNLLSKVKEI